MITKQNSLFLVFKVKKQTKQKQWFLLICLLFCAFIIKCFVIEMVLVELRLRVLFLYFL